MSIPEPLLLLTLSLFQPLSTEQTIILAQAPASPPTLQSGAAIIMATPSGAASKSFRDGFGFLTALFFSLLCFLNKVGEKLHSGLFWGLNYNCADVPLSLSRLLIFYLALFRALYKKRWADIIRGEKCGFHLSSRLFLALKQSVILFELWHITKKTELRFTFWQWILKHCLTYHITVPTIVSSSYNP